VSIWSRYWEESGSAGRGVERVDEVRCQLAMGAVCGDRDGGTPDGLEQEEVWLEEIAQLELEERARRGLDGERHRFADAARVRYRNGGERL
jgi:hypothetical protein